MKKAPRVLTTAGLGVSVPSESSMNLIEFVNSLSSDWVLAPIYRKGASMRSGKEATGKNPLEVAFDRDLGPADVALQLEKNDKLGAVGLFTGRKGRGLVILDVDANLSALKRKWGDSIKGAPVATSTKKNAAKFIFRVPEELWGEVSGSAMAKTTTRLRGSVGTAGSDLVNTRIKRRQGSRADSTEIQTTFR